MEKNEVLQENNDKSGGEMLPAFELTRVSRQFRGWARLPVRKRHREHGGLEMGTLT